MQSATTILALKVEDPNDPAFLMWRDRIEQAAQSQRGFDASEVFQPQPGIQDRWVLLLRFQDGDSLKAWLETKPFEEARPYDPIQVTVGESGRLRGPVSLVVDTRVQPERLEAFRAWQAEMEAAERKFPGFLDSRLLAPVPGLTDGWTIVVRFDSVEHLDAWIESDARRTLMQRVEPEMHGNLRRVVSSFDGWFPLSVDAPPPPTWKQALTVLVAIYPLVMVLSLYLQLGLPFASQIFFSNVLSTIALSWVAMPLLNRLLKPWLFPKKPSRLLDLAGTVGLMAACALMVLLFNAIGK